MILIDILYLITDGKGNYIRYDLKSKKFVPIRNKFLADKWEDRAKAQNILNSSLPKQYKKKFRVRETVDDRTPAEKEKMTGVRDSPSPAPKAIQDKHDIIGVNKSIVNQEKTIASISVSVSYPSQNKNIEKIKANIRYLTEIANEKDQRIAILIEQLTQIDRELSDVAHYMEFNVLDGCRGYKAYKLFHDKRLRRRIIKDELTVLQGLSKCQIDSAMLTEIKAVAENLKDRKYRPRALPELFE